jgi:hypothetical protein
VADFDRKALERLGAQARLSALQSEIAAIRRAFPGIGRGQQYRPEDLAPRRRKVMSPANRRAVSIRMKKYWADRRKAKAAKKS